MMQVYNDIGKQLTLSDFKDLEKLIGMDVPDDLKTFYLQQNGGTPLLGRVPIAEDSELEIAYFEPVKYSDDELVPPIELSYKRLFLMGEPTFNKFCIPIGCTDLGDGIYYSLEENDIGSIFYYVHDTDEDSHFRKLAPSLQSLLDNLSERDTDRWA